MASGMLAAVCQGRPPENLAPLGPDTQSANSEAFGHTTSTGEGASSSGKFSNSGPQK